MTDDELKDLEARVHESVTVFNYNGNKVPCIIFPEPKFDEIMGKVAGKAISIDTNLNILQDGLGHVFVEIVLTFSQGDIEEKILLNANSSLDFFKSLADTAMIALSSPHSEVGKENVFMIQLPKPEKATEALEKIKLGLKTQNPDN